MSNLNDDLMAAGFRPVPLDIDGVVAWTGWRAPDEDVYERYYGYLTEAMYAQVERMAMPGKTLRSLMWVPALANAARRERLAVVSAWRSASMVLPPDDDWSPTGLEFCTVCGCDAGYCGGPTDVGDMDPDTSQCACYDEELGEPMCCGGRRTVPRC